LFECLSYCIFSSKVSSSSFSIVNTLLKKSANISAFSPSSEAIILIPSRSVCSSETPDFVFLFKGDYDKLRQELDIDWNEILNDKNTTDMIDIFMSKLTFSMKHTVLPLSCDNRFCLISGFSILFVAFAILFTSVFFPASVFLPN
jgi:hypothetical protein